MVRRKLWFLAIIVLVGPSLACGSSPTATPAPAPTQRPTFTVIPTNSPTPAVVEPTAMLQPTEPPASEPQPTEPQPAALPTDVTTPPAEVASASCAPGLAIQEPAANAALSGQVTIRGTANVDGFQFYKLEYAAGLNPKLVDWMMIGELHHEPVVGGELGTWDVSGLAAGDYLLHLVVVDVGGNYPEPCQVPVVIEAAVAPAPTQTRVPVQAQPTAGPCGCGADLYNCSDFATHAEAQSCFDYCRHIGAGDVHQLDADGNGQACESLP
jgi:hypothetical protein